MPEALIPRLAVDVCNTRNAMRNDKSGTETLYMLVEGVKPSAHSFQISFGAIVIISSFDKNIVLSLGRSAYGIVCGRDAFGVQHKCGVYMLHSRTVVHAAVTEEDMVRQPYPSGVIQLIDETGGDDFDVDDLVSGASGEKNWREAPYGDTAVNVIRRAAEAHMRKSEHRKTMTNKKKQDDSSDTGNTDAAHAHKPTEQPAVEVPVGPQMALQEADGQPKRAKHTADNADPYKRIYTWAAGNFKDEGRPTRNKRAREHNDAEFESAATFGTTPTSLALNHSSL